MTAPERLYTVEEYLALDAAAPRGARYEYANGLATLMAGAEPNHELIVASLLGRLHQATRDGRCRVYGSNLRVKVRASRAYKYPDVSGLCGRPEFEPTRPQTFLNPSLLIEVLSPSTEGDDRGAKFAHYQLIPTLSEYLLVAQDHTEVERYLRAGASWQYDRFTRPDDVVTLPSLNFALRVGDVYEQIELPSGPPLSMPRLVRETAPDWGAPV